MKIVLHQCTKKNPCKPFKVSELLERKAITNCGLLPTYMNSIFEYIQHNCSLCKYVKMYNTLTMSSFIECHAVNYKSVHVEV